MDRIRNAYGVHLQHTTLSTEVLRFLTAGMICVSVEPGTGQVYILLGQETRFYDMRNENGKWCDFGGTVEHGEDEMYAAAREFAEESMCVVQLFDTEVPLCTAEYISEVHRLLQNQDYLLKVSIVLPPEDVEERVRLYYIKEVPWQPAVVARFAQTREVLLQWRDTPNTTTLPEYMREHPGLTAQGINPHFIEKLRVQWWSISQLKEIVHNRGWYRNQQFRRGFLPVLKIIIAKLSNL